MEVMNVKKLTLSALLIAVGTMSAHLVYIPVGVAKCFPIQHAINVITAVMLGPMYGLANAFLISLLRNMLGTGSLLAFPGSMFGALLAGIVFKMTQRKSWAALGEVVGTGLLGGIAAYPIAKYLIGKEVAVFFFVIPFLVSTLGGSLIGYMVLNLFEKSGILKGPMIQKDKQVI